MTRKNTFKKVAAITALAGAVGYLAGVLSAPKSGKKSRKIITNKLPKEVESAEDKLRLLYSQLSDLIVAADGEEKGLEAKQLKRFKEALSAAKKSKKKLSSVIEGVKNRESDDEDLDRAIKEAEKAIKHAKTFLLKK